MSNLDNAIMSRYVEMVRIRYVRIRLLKNAIKTKNGKQMFSTNRLNVDAVNVNANIRTNKKRNTEIYIQIRSNSAPGHIYSVDVETVSRKHFSLILS